MCARVHTCAAKTSLCVCVCVVRESQNRKPKNKKRDEKFGDMVTVGVGKRKSERHVLTNPRNSAKKQDVALQNEWWIRLADSCLAR
jgi:hypothetical protein